MYIPYIFSIYSESEYCVLCVCVLCECCLSVCSLFALTFIASVSQICILFYIQIYRVGAAGLRGSPRLFFVANADAQHKRQIHYVLCMFWWWWWWRWWLWLCLMGVDVRCLCLLFHLSRLSVGLFVNMRELYITIYIVYTTQSIGVRASGSSRSIGGGEVSTSMFLLGPCVR